MSDEKICPTCGRPIPPDAPSGVCPVCLLTAANVSSPIDSLGGARDTNLLFALFAHLLRYLDAEQFVEAIDVWAGNPSVSIADNLVDRGILSKASRQYLEGLIAHGLDFYEGNVSKTLESLGGHERVATILQSGAATSANDLVRTRLDLKLPENFFDRDATPGTTLEERPGRYTGSSEYSRGGMGRILLVHDELLARDIALKELLPPSDVHAGEQGLEPSPVRHAASLVARFLREARVTGRLEHPSIVPVYELGRRENGSLYYTMRLVRGKTLRVVLQECKTLEDRLKLLPNFVDVCMGIAYAHSRGVVHRDIKPSNIMIGEFGETVIIDWGLAKVVGAREPEHPSLEDTLHRLHGDQAPGADKTLTGEVLGSPHYMSPEQAAGRVDDIDARSDVFSLGSVLYEILTDHAAFDQTSLESLIEQIQHQDPVPPGKRQPRIPRELASICLRALEKEKGKRYASAKEMADDINRFLSGALVSAYNYSIPERIRHFYSLHKVALNTLMASLVAVVATVIVAFVRIDNSRDEAVVARNNEEVAHQQTELARDAEVLARTDAEVVGYQNSILLAAELLKNRNIAGARDTLWSTQPVYRRWEWGYLVQKAYEERYRIPGYAGIQEQPGNRILASFYRDKPISVRDINTGAPLFELPVPPFFHVNYAEISPPEAHLAALIANGSVHVWDLNSRQELYVKPPSTGVASIVFSRDGSVLLVARKTGAVEIWETGTGTVQTTFEAGAAPAGTARFSPDERYVHAYLGIDETRQIAVWERATQQRVLLVPADSASMSSSNLLGVLDEGKVTFWSPDSGQQLETTLADQDQIRSVQFRPDSTQILAWSQRGSVTQWDAATGALVREFWLADYQPIQYFVMSPDGALMAMWGHEDRYIIFDLSTGLRLHEAIGLPSDTYRAQFSANGSMLLATTDQLTGVWDVQSPAQRVLRQDADSILAGVAVSRDGTRAAYLAGDRRIHLFNTTGADLNTGLFMQGTGGAMVAALSVAGDELIAVRDEFTPAVVDVATGMVKAVLLGHEGFVHTIDSDPERDEVATGSWDTKVRIWRRSTGELLRELVGHSAPVISVRYADNGQRLMTVDQRGNVRLWDAASGARVAEAKVEDQPTVAGWSPRMDTVAVGGESGRVYILNAESLAIERTISGVVTNIQSLCYLDPERIAYSDRTSLRIWNVPRGGETLVIPGDLAGISDLHMLPDRTSLLALSSENVLRVLQPRSWTDSITRSEFEARALPPPEPVTHTISGLPSRIVTVTTPERLLDAVRKLRAAAPQALPSPSGSGIQIAEGALQQAVVHLGLRPGDSLAAVGRNEIRTAAEAETALAELMSQLESGTTPGLVELRVARGVDTVLFQMQILPIARIEVAVQVSMADAVDSLSAVLSAISAREDSVIELSRSSALAFGDDPGPRDALDGLWLSESGADVDRERFRRMKLSPADRIVSVNGNAIKSVGIFRTAIQGVLQQVQAGTPAQLSIELERGNFQSVQVAIDIR